MIDMEPSADQQQIVASVARVLAERLPVTRHRRRILGTDLPAATLREIAELGWIGLGVPEASGGHGMGLVDDVLVCRELGRQLAPLPLLAASIGARLAAHANQPELVRALATGTSRAGFALGSHAPDDASTRYLIDAEGAEWIVGFSAQAAWLMHATVVNQRAVLPSADPGARLERGSGGTVRHVVGANARAEGLLLGSACMLGMAEATRDLAVAYASQREQFDQPIGAFQAIKHLCADMALRAESAKCLMFYAAIGLEKRVAHAAAQAVAAKVIAANACLENAAANIQIHGGMGFTDEVDGHLYVKRAQILERIFGNQRAAQSQLADGAFFRLPT